MLFNSGLFFQFFAAFLLLYYIVRNHLTTRNWLIVAASYVFYGAWDYRFLFLLIFSSLMDFFVGQGLEKLKAPRARKRLLMVSIVGNLTFLGFFKYCDFFIQSFVDLLHAFNLQADVRTLGIVLPVGISFYTFQAMSYAMDVYRREARATANLPQFLAFVSFFPQLVAGPIERARHMLPQFGTLRIINAEMIREGLWLGIWGMFKKVVIADNLAPLVEMVYGAASPSGPMVMVATVAFALQIYCDFSGYSDIARGTARILGFDLMLNFNLPYTAASIREFWQRWHISLSTWLRDYLYIPLGGNRRGPGRTSCNLVVTMLLGGLWHGARWNFLLWGAWHGAALAINRAASNRSVAEGSRENAASDSNNTGGALAERRYSKGRAMGWFCTMAVVLYGWLFFRAESFSHILTLHRSFAVWTLPPWAGSYVLNAAAFSAPLVVMEIWQRRAHDVSAPLKLRGTWLGLLEGILLIGIVVFWQTEKVPFIYFQF